MKQLLVLIIVLGFGIQATAEDPEEIIEKFFSYFPEQKEAEAVEYLFGTNPWMSKIEDTVASVKGQMSTLPSLVGDYFGRDFVAEKSMGDSLRGYTYVAKYDRQPIRIEFVFYKADKKWVIYKFTFDDDLADDLVSSMRRKSLYEF